ncbi:MAG: DUF1015 domain-containing protein [Gammaproteobacteria bacterium]
MPHIRAFTGYLVTAARAAAVVSPAYDAVSPAMRRQFAEAHPHNFLNTMRLREDFPADAQPGTDELLARNKAHLDKLLGDGSFEKFDSPCMFLYRLRAGAHTQTGVVCEISVDEYADGRVRKHENTRSDKEDLLAMYQKAVGVSSSPICLAYPHDRGIDRFLAEQTQSPPELDFTAEDGVVQQIWRIDAADAQRALCGMFAQIGVTYLTDGHHRAASGLRYAQMMRAQSGNRAEAPHNQLLVALFSTEQLELLPFHRAVRDLNGMSEAQFLEKLARDFQVEPAGAPFAPCGGAPGEFGMLLGGNWRRLRIRENRADLRDPVASLDAAILQDHILAPLLGIADMRIDARLDYISGAQGLDGLAQHAADGWAVCFACAATSIAQLMNVADAGALMPPKSTYFDPKARSGIFIRPK